MKFLFILLYLLNGKPVLEQKHYDTMEKCLLDALERKDAIDLDEHKDFIAIGCAPVKAEGI